MRRRNGQSLIEVTVGIVIFVPIFLVLFDLSVILFAVQQNESVCRNAVQSAASGDPSEAKSRALAVIEQHNRSSHSHLVGGYRLNEPIEVHITSSPVPVQDIITENMVSAGGPVTGTVTASTEVDVKPFVVQAVYTGKSPLTFRSKQSFPIKYVLAPTMVAPRM
jgi:hypothetical protein